MQAFEASAPGSPRSSILQDFRLSGGTLRRSYHVSACWTPTLSLRLQREPKHVWRNLPVLPGRQLATHIGNHIKSLLPTCWPSSWLRAASRGTHAPLPLNSKTQTTTVILSSEGPGRPCYALQHRRGRRAAMSAPGTPPEAPGTPPESMLLWELEAIVNNKDGFFLIERQG